jgi:adenylate kinase
MDSLFSSYKGKFSAILIFGPPGVGKGTLGHLLATSKEQYHLASGEIFRTLTPYSAAGKLFYSYASRGELVPCEPTVQIWRHYVEGLIATNVFLPDAQDLLLDGFPRTVAQAKLLEEFVTVRHVILLESESQEELIKRLQRRVRSEGRFEDMPKEAIERRFSVYENEIDPLMQHYPSHMVSRINADQKPLEVFRDVLVKLSHMLSHRTQLD